MRTARRSRAQARGAFVHSLSLAVATVVIVVPMGTALGLALAHLTSRRWRVVRATLLAMIAIPHAALGVVLFFLFLFVVRVHLTSTAQVIAHVTITLPFVAPIIWTRLVLLDVSFEEQAADLGAPPLSTVTRVLLRS